MSVAGLGAFAGGLGSGIERGIALADRAEDRRYLRGQRERQGRMQEQEDAELAAVQEANQAGAAVMQRHQQDWQKQQPGPTLDGAPVPTNPFKPTPQMLLEAGRARTDTLLAKTGPTKRWLETWSQDEAMRTQVRAGAGQKVKQALAAGADLTGPLGEFFGTIDDGYQVQGVQMGQGPDGKPVISVQRANRYTGQADAKPLLIPAEQLVRDIDMMSANPVDLAKHSLSMNLEAFKQRGATSLEDKRQEGRMTLADANNKSAEKRTERSATATEAAAQMRAGSARSTANAEAIRALGQERTSVDNDIRTLTQQLKDARPTDRPGIQSQLEEARERAKDVRTRLAALSAGGDGGAARAPGAAPAAAPGTPAGLPPGARQIGTSGGKPVFQTPDGKRFIQE